MSTTNKNELPTFEMYLHNYYKLYENPDNKFVQDDLVFMCNRCIPCFNSGKVYCLGCDMNFRLVGAGSGYPENAIYTEYLKKAQQKLKNARETIEKKKP